MSAWLRTLILPVVMVAGATLASPKAAQAQVYGYYAAPGYGYPAPAPYAYYGAPYGYYPPYYGGYYPRPAIGFSVGIPFGYGYGGYRPYYHYGRRW